MAVDRNIELAEKRTLLAVERTFIAFERTLMAWLRTSFAMIGFGYTVSRFFQYVHEQAPGGGESVAPIRLWATQAIGLALVTIGTASLLVAVVQHRRRVDSLRGMGLVPQWNLALWVAAAVAVLGVFAFASLVLDL